MNIQTLMYSPNQWCSKATELQDQDHFFKTKTARSLTEKNRAGFTQSCRYYAVTELSSQVLIQPKLGS